MSTVSPVRFISVGRLEKEKGTHLLLSLCHQLENSGQGEHIELHIFGSGSLQKDVESEAQRFHFLQYHGHQPKDKVFQVWKTCKYTFMLSSFLETFGLVALDSLSVGVPVIGYKKGGLTPFILDNCLQPSTYIGADESEQLFTLIQYLLKDVSQQTRQSRSLEAKRRYQNYLPGVRISNFKKYSGLKPGSAILLVSDYAVDIGGIENLLFFMKGLLEAAGYSVDYLGYEKKLPQRRRYFHLLRTACNIPFAYRLSRFIRQRKPDLIRWHSVHRWIGRLPIWMQKNAGATQRIMYHDFGLFHPFPRSVCDEKQLGRSSTFRGFMREGLKMGWRLAPLLLCKRVAIRMTRYLLAKQVSKHFVPSPYMKEIVKHTYPNLPNDLIEVFPHFVKS